METSIYERFKSDKAKGKKNFVVLIDPDDVKTQNIKQIVDIASRAKVDCFLLGGSLIMNDTLDYSISQIKEACNIPVVLFPGNSLQLSYRADAMLFLSLISGRNPDLLIGKHVETASFLYASPLEIISTGYMLIDGGVPTSVSYMSNTYPIPSNKDDIAVCTALAGELIGMKIIYMDAGSGAKTPIPKSMIQAVGERLKIPLIVGGGIRTPEKALENVQAGADVIVVGNAIEKDPALVTDIAAAVHSVNASLDLKVS